VAGKEKVEVLKETQPTHNVSKGQGKVVSSNVHVQEDHLQTKHQFLYNDTITSKYCQKGKNNSYPTQNYEQYGKIVDAGELIGGKSIETIDTRRCYRLEFGSLQKTGRRDPVECKGSIDEAVIDGEEDQK
jgi:hypothetical protein